MEPIAAISAKRFTASATREGGDILVRFKGNAESNAEIELPEFLKAVHDVALREQIRRVKVDMTTLAFMNSSCFKDFIVWLEKVRECAAERQYQIVFMSNAAQHWQRRSLYALSCFAKDHVTIESAAAPAGA
jgi:hypothetical protein